MSYTVTKQYRDLPAAHRQHNHDGHCRFVHGHNWGFDITLTCDKLDDNGFVVDVGKLKAIKDFLNHWFDHTLLINDTDPWKDRYLDAHTDGLVDVRIVSNCGMEELARFVLESVAMLPLMLCADAQLRGLRVDEVVVWEDSKNRSCYRP